MRTLRLSLVGTVIFGLLGSLSVAVVAQEAEPDPLAPATFTYTTEPVGESRHGHAQRHHFFFKAACHHKSRLVGTAHASSCPTA